MLRKLLLSPWFGPLPPWKDQWLESVWKLGRAGYDILMPTDLGDFTRRVEQLLGVRCSVEAGGGKIHDYRPALALIYPELVAGYDFWGHTDLDCVYGRVEHFWPDVLLDSVDVASDHWEYVCGPFCLYRNTPGVNEFFMRDPDWKARLESPAVSGWVETDFTVMLGLSELRTAYQWTHGYENAGACRWDGDRLMEGTAERSFFHFRRSKQWPKGLA